MNDLLKAAGYVLGLVIGVPVVWVSIRAGRFFGSTEETIKQVITQISRLAESITASNDKMDLCLEKHEALLGVHTTQITVLQEKNAWDGKERRETNRRRKPRRENP